MDKRTKNNLYMHWVSGSYFHLIKSDTTQELSLYLQACKTVALSIIYSLIETTFASIELTFSVDHTCMNSRLKQPSGILCRRSVGFFSWAFLVSLMKESKKTRRKQPGKLMVNSCSQPVNLPVVRAGQFAHCPVLNEPPEPSIELTRYQW